MVAVLKVNNLELYSLQDRIFTARVGDCNVLSRVSMFVYFGYVCKHSF